MNIGTYFSKPLPENDNLQIHESDWLDVGEITIHSNLISVGDPIFFPGDQAEIKIGNGRYSVQAKAIDYRNDRRISRLRAVQNQITTSFQATYLSSISVDFARVGVCDPIVFLEAISNNTNGGTDLELYETVYSDPLGALYGVIMLDNHHMVFVQSGWGDGHYEVYQLQSESQLLGLEVIFIDENGEVAGG